MSAKSRPRGIILPTGGVSSLLALLQILDILLCQFTGRLPALYATPSSSATSSTRIKICPAIRKKYLPFLVVIVSRLPFHPSDSGRQPFPALCRLFFSLARSCRRLLPRRKYLSDGHSVFQCLKFHLTTDIFSPFGGYSICKISIT